jgi:antitoxin (DNA-binding transcriptional repressor) of toxin-antitoxin stability system
LKTVNVQYAKTQLSRLVEEAAAGETIVIGKAGKPMAMLVAWQPELKKRQLGAWRDKVWIADDLDAPLLEIGKLFLDENAPKKRSRRPENQVNLSIRNRRTAAGAPGESKAISRTGH